MALSKLFCFLNNTFNFNLIFDTMLSKKGRDKVMERSEIFEFAMNFLGGSEEIIIRQYVDELEKIVAKVKGLSGYSWKDGEYIDDIQEYFNR